MFELKPVEEVFRHFLQFYAKTWPFIILLHVLAVTAVILAVRKTSVSDSVISVSLAIFWLWDGIVHQLIFGIFDPIHRYTMSILFILQGALFLLFGLIKPRLSFQVKSGSAFSILGGIFILYSLFFYPLIGYLSGHGFVQGGPLFGVICPITIYTFGILLWTERSMPKILIIIPLFWALLGFTGVVSWHIWEDIGLIFSGIVGGAMLLIRKKARGGN